MRRPGIKVLFVGTTEFADLADGLGSFVSVPITAEEVTDHVVQMLTADYDRRAIRRFPVVVPPYHHPRSPYGCGDIAGGRVVTIWAA